MTRGWVLLDRRSFKWNFTTNAQPTGLKFTTCFNRSRQLILL